MTGVQTCALPISKEFAAILFYRGNGELNGKFLPITIDRGYFNYLIQQSSLPGIQVIEITAINRNGKEFPIELTIAAVKQNGSEFFCAFIRDITERKKAESEVRNSEERYRSIFENALDGIFQSTPEGEFITVNPAMAKIFGYESPHEMISSITDIGSGVCVNPQDRFHIIDLQREHGQPVNFELRVKKKNKELIWVRANLHSVKDVGGKVQYLEGIMEDITERKKAEEQIVKEKELSGFIINSLPGVFYLYDKNGKFLRWNKNFETVSGYTGDEISRMQPLDFFDEDEKEILTERIGKVFTEGMGEVEAHFFTKDRRKILYYFNGWRTKFEERVCLIGMGIDITARKNAEQKIIEEKELSDSIINSLPGIFYLFDINQNFLRWNKNFEIVSGYSAEELKPMHALNFFDVDEQELAKETILRSLTIGLGEMDAHFLTKDRKKIPYHFIGQPSYFEGLPCMLGVGIDISERKKAEENTRHAEELYRNIFEHSLAGIYQKSPDGKFITVNPSMAKIFGYDNPTAFITSITDMGTQLYANPNDREWLRSEVAMNGFVNGFELQLLKRTKEIIWVRVNELMVNDKEGKPLYYDGTLEDITELKASEEKLKNQFEELQKINSELDHFVYSVSHDLRAPLSSILGILNIADLENPEATQKKYLGMIRKSISRLDGFIKDILDYSRNTRKEVQSEKIDFLEIMREVQSNLSHMSGMDRLKITIEINDTVPFYADRIRMEVIMNNLLSNSIKYCDCTKESSVFTMSVSTSVEKASIKISDNGIGIKEEHMDKVFNMFYKASETSTGSGLGLYITRETISKLDGTIKVRSEFGQYTAFDIIIPNLKSSKE